MNVLTFDSKNELSENLNLLKKYEIEFDNFYNNTELEKRLLENHYDLFIFNFHTSDNLWVDSVNKIRQSSNKPIILVSKFEEPIYLSAIEAGVTWCINKPFSNYFLERVIHNFLKEIKNDYVFVDLTFIFNSNIIIINNKKIHLTKTESSLLSILIKNKNIIVPFPKLLNVVFKKSIINPSRLYYHIKNLKIKLDIYGKCIRSIHSVGYSWIEKK